MDRASDFGSEGWRFESVRARQCLQEFEPSLALSGVACGATRGATKKFIAKDLTDFSKHTTGHLPSHPTI